MEEHKFQFLVLLFFGILVLATGLFLSGVEMPTTSLAVANLEPATTFSLITGVLLLAMLVFYLKARS